MTIVATLGLLAAPALSTWPLDGPVPLGELVESKPRLSATMKATCGGVSPRDVDCGAPIARGSCTTSSCSPVLDPGTGFTGTLFAQIVGRDASGQQQWIGQKCAYTAGGPTTVGPAVRDGDQCVPYHSAGCSAGACVLYVFSDCNCLRLRGSAAPPSWSGKAPPAGGWSVAAVIS